MMALVSKKGEGMIIEDENPKTIEKAERIMRTGTRTLHGRYWVDGYIGDINILSIDLYMDSDDIVRFSNDFSFVPTNIKTVELYAKCILKTVKKAKELKKKMLNDVSDS
jgi:hypothetical protein